MIYRRRTEKTDRVWEICLKSKQARLNCFALTRLYGMEKTHTFWKTIDISAWLYLRKHKCLVLEHIKNYIYKVDTFQNGKVSMLLCDRLRRDKYINNTMPYTPQLNRKTELLNRTHMKNACTHFRVYFKKIIPKQSSAWFCMPAQWKHLFLHGCDLRVKINRA